jgi:hypothetical protein
MDSELSAVASVPLEIPKGAQNPPFDLKYVPLGRLVYFQVANVLAAVPIYHPGRRCCLFACCDLSWRVACPPVSQG